MVRGILGQGGMGTVYLAEHRVIGRKVAIKVLNRDPAREESLVARFINESRARELVGHPGIVEVIDVGTLPDGVPYLVMEYLQGENLAQRIAKLGKLGVTDAAGIAWDTASAVGAAHTKGIIHRDLKPANLFLAADPAAPEIERLKVLDFGIAKLHATPTSVSTQTGAVMGTPVYMSPEQCRGARGEVDHRSDIYSLGIILYEMLCGKPPFRGDAFGDLLMRHMTEAPPPMSASNPDVPKSLEALVMTALAKRREDRFQSMRELQNELTTLTEGRTEKTLAAFGVRRLPDTLVPPAPARTPVMTADVTSRRRRWVVGGAIAGVLVAGGFYVLRTERPAQAPAVRPAHDTTPPVAPLPTPPAPPDAAATVPAPAVTTIPPAPAAPATRPSKPGNPSSKKRVRKPKIDVKQW